MLKKTGTCISVIIVLMLIIVNGCEQQAGETQSPFPGKAKIGSRGILYARVEPKKDQGEPCEQALIRKKLAERLDREDILYTARVAVDRDEKMLEVPENMLPYLDKEFTVAKTAPEVEFCIVPVEPRFSTEYNDQAHSGWWANYCQSNYDVSSGKFYSGVGDHCAYDAHIYLVEYDPAEKKVHCLPEVNRGIGKPDDRLGDSILHGWLDFYQSKHLTRPHLWFCTYWPKFPEPSDEDFANGYEGGHIVSYDMATEEYVDYGVPLPRTSWPYHRVDTRRGMLYAVSLFGEFLAWDINEQKVRWAGYLPKGMHWYTRAILLDEETGMVYTSNDDDSDTSHNMIRYDPVKNRFTVLDCPMPQNAITGERDHMRAQTRDRDPNGLFWGVTSTGELFSFDPDSEEIVDRGLNWQGEGRYTCTMELSPDGRYIYYQVMSYYEGSPVIQYDTRTGNKKALAFTVPFYNEKYGYLPTGAYSFKCDDKGEKLFMLWNGAFAEYGSDLGVDRFGLPSVMMMHIPESERVE